LDATFHLDWIKPSKLLST